MWDVRMKSGRLVGRREEERGKIEDRG